MSVNVFPTEIFTTFSNVDLVDSSGTWAHPSGYSSARKVLIIGVGGGGGGGGGSARHANSNGNAYFAPGGGGGGSGYFSISSINIITTDITITIGTGGGRGAGGSFVSDNGGSSRGSVGGDGGTTTVQSESGTILTANGGLGGFGGTDVLSSNNFTAIPASGGTGGSTGGKSAYVSITSEVTNKGFSGEFGTVKSNFLGAFPYISSTGRIIPSFPYLSVAAMSGSGGGSCWKPDSVVNKGEYQMGGKSVSPLPGNSIGGNGGDPVVLNFSSDVLTASGFQDYFVPAQTNGEVIFTSSASVVTRIVVGGFGGDGIYGGGGGGGGAALLARTSSYPTDVSTRGGDGGRGGSGCVWIFY